MIVKLYKILGPTITKYVGSRFFSLIMFSTPSVQQDFIISVFLIACLLSLDDGSTACFPREHRTLWVQNPDWPIFWGFYLFDERKIGRGVRLELASGFLFNLNAALPCIF